MDRSNRLQLRRILAPALAAVLLSSALALSGCARQTDDPVTPPAPIAEQDRSSGGAMWGANYFPNIQLVTHEGKEVRFFDDLLKDKVVALNFIYTQCADACPMETARMLEVQRLLADRLGKDIFFYSISIDPTHDSPAVLKQYAEKWKTGPGWTFLTGKEEDITLLRKKLGVYEADLTQKDHNLNLIIGNQKTGRWMKRSPYENPYILATQLGSWLHNWKLPATKDLDYAKAPPVRNISSGEEMFRSRCAMCHTVGGGDRDEVLTRRVGPDLFNVTKQRGRNWLLRWIMEPDKMLAEKDPLALQLYAQYKNVAMPNLRVRPSEAEELLKYIEEESAGVERRAALAHQAAMAAADKEEGPDASPAAKAAQATAAPAELPTVALSESGRSAASSLLAHYEALRARLAADDLPGAKASVAALAEAATSTAEHAEAMRQPLLDVASAARTIATCPDVKAARLTFGQLSRTVIALLVGNPSLREGRHLFRCPMAKGYQKWVQTASKLNNPYWGSRMLTCGKKLSEWSI